MYRAELIADHPGIRLDRDISPGSIQPSPRFCLRDGEVLALDDTLTATAHRSVKLSSSARLLNAAEDLSVVVAADQSDLVVIAAAESRIPLPEAEVACLFPGGHILVTAPVVEHSMYEDADYTFRTGHRVLLINAETGRVLDEEALDIPDSYLSATQHPVAPLTLLTAGLGQDGSRVFAVAETDGRLSVEPVTENVIAASFNSSGTRLLTTPHPSFEPVLRLLTWPDRVQVSSATAADLGLAGARFGVCACFADDGRVLAMTSAGRFVALDEELNLIGEISVMVAGQGPNFMIGVSPATFAVQTWRDGAAGASVWHLPRFHQRDDVTDARTS